MRMLLPDVKLRRRIRELLSTFYNDCQYPDFNVYHVLYCVEEETKADPYTGQCVKGL
jgi:hypothetical protein